MTGSHFSFDRAAFAEVHAHGAPNAILAARVLERSDSRGCRFVELCEVPPGAGVATHTHGLEDEEIYVVVSGNGSMTLDGAEIAVGPGDVVVNRPGGTHSLRNDGPGPLRMVVIDMASP